MDSFVENVKEAFSFLTQKYGFSDPEVKDYGREIFVEFNRNDETVSVSMEIGTEPIIEIFLLCEGTQEKPLQWAERNGKQRYRKFPKFTIIKNFFHEAPNKFEETESEWLKT